MKFIIVLLVLTSLPINIFSQQNEDQYVNPFWEIYNFNYLNTPAAGRGFTGIASSNNISGIIINPASVDFKSNYQLNFQYTYKTSQKWLAYYFNDPPNLEQQWFSGSAGFGLKINKTFLTGALYNNLNSMHFSLGEVTTLYGQIDDYYTNIIYHSLYIPVVYSNKGFHSGAGLIVTHTRTTSPPSVNQNDPDNLLTSWMFRGTAGFRYEFDNGLSIGAKFQSGGKNNLTINYPVIANEISIQGLFPWKAGAGIQYLFPKTNFKMLFDYNYSHNISDYLKDRHDIHLGMEAIVNKNWIVRGGFFTLNDYRDKTAGYINVNDNLNQLFLTIGSSYIQKNFEANIALLTSEISSGIIKNTYINGGITFNF